MDDESQELNYRLVQKLRRDWREHHGSIFNAGLGCVVSTHKVDHHAAAGINLGGLLGLPLLEGVEMRDGILEPEACVVHTHPVFDIKGSTGYH